jgi:hypothetical protein
MASTFSGPELGRTAHNLREDAQLLVSIALDATTRSRQIRAACIRTRDNSCEQRARFQATARAISANTVHDAER